MASTLAKLGMLDLLVAVCLVSAARAEVAVRDEVFGNRQAAELVLRGRSFDPMFTADDKADREQAVRLYERAMALQPGAKINAALANRVAQLYAHYADRDRTVRPDQAKAALWWRRCIAETSERQLLWAQAHMGLGCALFLQKKPRGAVIAFRAILDFEAEKAELPDWRVPPRHGAAVERERARLRRNAGEIQVKAVDMVHYVLVRVDGAAAVAAMLEIAKEKQGTQVAAHASRLAHRILAKSDASLYRYRDLPWTPDDELVGVGDGPSDSVTRRGVAPGREEPAGSALERTEPAVGQPRPARAPEALKDEAELGWTLPLLLAGGAGVIALAVAVGRRILVRRR